jgi:hypothetical protein
MIFSSQDIKFVVEKSLYEKAKPISIGFVKSFFGRGEFKITSNMQFFGGGGCCG